LSYLKLNNGMSKFDEEVNKILLEVNFMDGLKTFGQGVAGLGREAMPVINTLGKGIEGAAKIAAGVAGANLEVNPKLKSFLAKTSQMATIFFNKMRGIDYGIKIDDNLIKTLYGVYGPLQDTTRYSSRVNLGGQPSIIVSMINNYNGYTLRKMGEEMWAIISSNVTLKSSSPAMSATALSGDELISSQLQTIANLSNNKAETARYNASLKSYNTAYVAWLNDKKAGKTVGPEPRPPDDPTDLSRNSKEKSIGSFIMLHEGKNTYKEAIEHLLQFLTSVHKNVLQRSAATAKDYAGTLNNTKT
jgi:hypothetical protein